MKDIYKIDSLENFKNYIKNTFTSFNDMPFLNYCIILRKYEFDNEILNMNRRILEISVKEHINNINTNKHNKLKEKIKQINDKCHEEWTICIYDTESVYKVQEYFILTSSYNFNKNISDFVYIEDYFSSSRDTGNFYKKTSMNNFKNVLIERKIHMCPIEKRIGIIDDVLTDTKSSDKSLDKSIDDDENLSNLSNSNSNSNSNLKKNIISKHETLKRNYKKFSKLIFINF